jgi:ATP-dependent Clp protease adaptor protein ClpS
VAEVLEELVGKSKTRTSASASPFMYQVVMYNDDYTPMEFVVEVLMQHFQMDYIKATTTMMQVHYQGKAVCGLYSKDVAETKAERVISIARKDGYPLLCLAERP